MSILDKKLTILYYVFLDKQYLIKGALAVLKPK